MSMLWSSIFWFESFVNLEGCKTNPNQITHRFAFESFVNLEGCKTWLSFY